MGRSRDLADGTLAELNVDSNTLAVDATNNRVGIGTSSPSNKLKIYDSTATSTTFKANTLLNVSSNGSGADATINLTDGVANNAVISQLSGQLLFGTGSGTPERMRINSSGDARIAMDNFAAAVGSSNGGVSLRRVSDGGYFEICRTSTASRNQVIFYNGNGAVGSISTNGSSTAYNTSSDYRLKENVVEVTDGIDRVKLLKPSRFNFIVDPDKTVDGFLAHEVADVVPEAITGTKDAVDADGNPEYQGIDQSKLVPLLTAALQEAITKIESLETEMITVKSRLDALESA